MLAAEDNAVNQLVLKTLLGQVGVEPVIVDDGARGGRRPGSAEPWDVILMDVQMPVMDGPTATRADPRPRSAEPAAPRTPIVALTANAMAHQVARIPGRRHGRPSWPSRSRRGACSRPLKPSWATLPPPASGLRKALFTAHPAKARTQAFLL